MVWLGSQGEGGAGGWMDCAVSELRARNGRGRIPQSGEAAGPYGMCW